MHTHSNLRRRGIEWEQYLEGMLFLVVPMGDPGGGSWVLFCYRSHIRGAMKFQLLVCTGIVLVALVPCQECRAFSKPSASVAGAPPPVLPEYQPFVLRMGEEYFLRLGNLHKYSPSSFGASRLTDAPSSNFVRALQQQLQSQQWGSQQGLRAGVLDGADAPYAAEEEPTERGKRAEEPPISLDLTFHLLREVLEMARAEQIAQQAHSNRKLMDIIGK
ncbi:corticoliberin [Pseudophryne corroboree]|uniref:corticoliberin n=1 Tax=Pseudophryne corroboree TaxID=495146 RepID=UPI003081C42B